MAVFYCGSDRPASGYDTEDDYSTELGGCQSSFFHVQCTSEGALHVIATNRAIPLFSLSIWLLE